MKANRVVRQVPISGRDTTLRGDEVEAEGVCRLAELAPSGPPIEALIASTAQIVGAARARRDAHAVRVDFCQRPEPRRRWDEIGCLEFDVGWRERDDVLAVGIGRSQLLADRL
jgi:hypothetical protein